MKIKGTIMVMAFTIFLVVAGLIFDNAYVNSQSNRAGLNEFVTSDGVTLRYQDVGTGQPFVMIPGWSQTAAMWKYQISEFSKNYRVLAIDMRGHGMSDKPDNGYRIQRLSKDVHEFINSLNLKDVVLMGHSMGTSVIWGYYDLFGSDRLAKLILVDQMPFITSNPAWSKEELEAAGAIFTPQALYETCNAIAGPKGVETRTGFVGGMFPCLKVTEIPEYNWIVRENLKFPPEYAATLLYNHCTQDWRPLLKRIKLPTLVVGAKCSHIPWKSMEWVSKQIPGAELLMFQGKEDGASHFMFLENPEKFNKAIRAFLAK